MSEHSIRVRFSEKILLKWGKGNLKKRGGEMGEIPTKTHIKIDKEREMDVENFYFVCIEMGMDLEQNGGISGKGKGKRGTNSEGKRRKRASQSRYLGGTYTSFFCYLLFFFSMLASFYLGNLSCVCFLERVQATIRLPVQYLFCISICYVHHRFLPTGFLDTKTANLTGPLTCG